MSAPTLAKRSLAALIVLACPVIAVVFVLKPKTAPEPSPVRLVAASRFGATPVWSEVPLSGNIPYQWYGNDAYLYRRRDQSLAASDGAPGKPDPLAGVKSSYLAVGGDLEEGGMTGPVDWLLSPDRRWLLTYVGSGRSRRWAAMTLDGTRKVTFPARFYFRPLVCWKGDNSGWIELFRGRNGPAVGSYDVAPGAALAPVAPLAELHEGFFGQPEVLGGVGSDGFVVATWVQDERRRVPIHIFHAGRPKEQPRRLGVVLPRQANLMESELSPDGRRIAWVFVVPNRGPHPFRLPFFKPSAPETRQQLWVSDLDGGRMRRIAVADPKSHEELKAIQFLRWLPSGKRISFVDGDSLYTIPAD